MEFQFNDIINNITELFIPYVPIGLTLHLDPWVVPRTRGCIWDHLWLDNQAIASEHESDAFFQCVEHLQTKTNFTFICKIKMQELQVD